MLGDGIASTCSPVASTVNHSNSFPPKKPNFILKINQETLTWSIYSLQK